MIHTQELKTITAQDFLMFGHGDLAYIKPVTLDDGSAAYAIHAADGEGVVTIKDRDTAIALATRNELVVMDVQ